jgi:hypothetical protein
MFCMTMGIVAAFLLLSVNAFAEAAIIIPVNYDMPNGNGFASDGMLNYWDRFYTGSGSTTTDNALLSGGLGDLTDGIIASDNWRNVEDLAGTGPYVGWVNLNPSINFHFATVFDFSTVRIHFDDSDGDGGVSAPVSVVINGITFPLADPVGSVPFFAEFDITSLPPVNELTIQLNAGNDWVFASEVQFSTTSSIPEPSSLVLTGLGGLVLMACSFRRRAR